MILGVDLPVELGKVDGLIANAGNRSQGRLQAIDARVVNTVSGCIVQAGVRRNLADVGVLIVGRRSTGAAAGFAPRQIGIGCSVEVRVCSRASDGRSGRKVVIKL